MKFIIDPKRLKSSLAIASGGLGGATLATQSIKIEAKDSSVFIYTNNMKIGYIVEHKNVEVVEEGEIIVDGSTFTRFVSAASDTNMTVVNKDNFLIIRDGRRTVRLNSLSDEDFIVPKVAENEVTTVDVNSFKLMLKCASPMTSNSGSIFDGVCIGKESITATDQTKAIIIPFKSGLEDYIVVTTDAIKELIKLSCEDKMPLRSDNKFLSTILEEEDRIITLTIQLLGGEYPDINEFNDKIEQTYHITVPLKNMASEVGFMSLISDNDEQVISMNVDAQEASIKFTASAFMGSDKSNSDTDYNVEDSNIPETGFSFNFKAVNMVSMLRSIKDFSENSFFDTDEVKIYFSANDKPIKIEAPGITQFLSAIRSY